MKINYLFFTLLTMIGITFSSCIKDEAIGRETDITEATIEGAKEYLSMTPTITNNKVFFLLHSDIKKRTFAPTFQLTEGATIEPANGTTQDFSNGAVKYTITSSDGLFKKVYNVSFINNTFISAYSFENVKTEITDGTEGIYHEFYEKLPTGEEKYDWASGNLGYNMLAETLLEDGQELSPEVYPTFSITNGYQGKGVKMVTRSTGGLGELMKTPLAAGNLYLGIFDFTFPPINSTKFGIPYGQKLNMPLSLTGYYKYKAGDNFKVNSTDGSNYTKDGWDAYAIIFEKGSDSSKEYLGGNHSFQDPRMVAMARLSDKQRLEANDWTSFEIPFTVLPGKTFDPENNYMITIVFSSSVEGDRFNGAVGSALYIDEVKLNYDKQ